MSTRIVTTLVAAVLVAAARAPAQGAPPAASLPRQALIRGVPFVSWREAESHDYPHEDIVNPSIEAVSEMVAWYWNDTIVSARAAGMLANSPTWMRVSSDSGGPRLGRSLAELKPLVARGIPVAVYLPLTPYGHPINPALLIGMELGVLPKVPLPNGPFSGTTTRMFPLELAPKLNPVARQMFGGDTTVTAFTESAFDAPRLLIGYDDARAVVILHDPIYGPAFEMPAADFERMWALTAHRGFVIARPDVDAVVARHANAPPYRPPTARERAAYEYFSGYALSSTGRVVDGIAHYRAGLAVVDGDTTYRYVLLLDLALSLEWQGQVNEAVAVADSASALVPEDPRVWTLIARLAARSTLPDRDRIARQAGDRVGKLKKDQAARERLYAKLQPDCYTMGVRIGAKQ